MDHNDAVQQNATERYLLDELDSELRDQFEEHLFDCQECALDVRAGAMFVEQSKVILAEPEASSVPEKRQAHDTAKPRWLAWLRPAFAVPVFALLLAVIGYQNFVMVPKLTQAANEPRVGPWVSVNVSTRGGETKQVKAQPGQGFGVVLNLPPQDGFASYAADLYNPAGKLEWSGSISMAPAEEARQIYVPGRNRQPGTYMLVVRGINPTGVSQELSRQSIELQIQ
jgi:anti-sigma factor RsiW